MARTSVAAVLCLAAVACSARRPPAPAQVPVLATASASEARPPPAPALIAASPGSNFAASPLTPMADQLVALADAALRGRPLPASEIPVERHADDDVLVRGEELPDPNGLQFIALALELDIALFPPRALGDGEGVTSSDSDPNGLETLLLLSHAGLKLGKLRPTLVSDARPPPRWLPAGMIANQLLGDIRDDQLEHWWVGAAEAELVGPTLAAELRELRAKPEDEARARKLVGRIIATAGFHFDDVGLLARDPRGEFWGMKLDFEQGDPVTLDAHPLLRVKRGPR